MDWLVEPEAYIWLDLNYVAIAEEMTYFLSTDDSNADVINIGAVGGF